MVDELQPRAMVGDGVVDGVEKAGKEEAEGWGSNRGP